MTENLPSTTGPKDQWVLLQRQSKAFLESGFLPSHIKTLAQAITIAWKGYELGVPPLQSFSSITVIKGKPCLSSELMLALIYQRVKGANVTFVTAPDKQATECEIEMQRPGGKPQSFRFTIEDARKAGIITSNSAWEKYPAAMLRARAISAGARAVFPDAIMGCYTPEELGGEPILDAEFSVEPEVKPETKPAIDESRTEDDLAGDAVDEITSLPNQEEEVRRPTEKQLKRLFAIRAKAGWTEIAVRKWIEMQYRKQSTKDLNWIEYDETCKFIESHPSSQH